MQEEDYSGIKAAIDEAGFFTTLHPDGEEGARIVLASRRTQGRLHGNSFWVSLKAGRRYLVTWSPACYLVPPGADLTALCLECLRASRSPIPEVPPDIASRYQLAEVAEDDFERV